MTSYKIAAATYPIRGLVAWAARALLALRKKRLIFVFGMTRSGTTMLGKFIALAPATAYVSEPVKQFLFRRFPRDPVSHRDEFWPFAFSEEQKSFRLHCLAVTVFREVLAAGRTKQTLCVKPICLVNDMQEVSRLFRKAAIIYISRHPCGRTESVLRQRKYVGDDSPVTHEDLEALGRDWGETHRNVQDLFQTHPEWHWVIFETIAADPVAAFEPLYERLGLAWSHDVKEEIVKATTGEDGAFYEPKRDSRKQADKWRDVLTEEQIEAIRRGCRPYETGLYDSF